MKYQAHRGVGTEFPENTLPAFEAAAVQGYDYIELDPNFTKDGKLLVLHDDTLNRTCRHSDGGVIEGALSVGDLTYEEVLKYDAGAVKSPKFKGTAVPLLSDVLDLARQRKLTVKLDNKIQRFDENQTELLYRTVESSGARVAFTCTDPEYIKKTVARFPNAEIHYDGYVDEEKLKEIKGLLLDNPLTVWLCLKSPVTFWVTLPTADAELCQTVKRYGRLGLWLLCNDDELKKAEELGADIIETTGALKPPRHQGGMVDCHTHTKFSHDSVCEPLESEAFAKKRRLFAFAITDHCDIEFCDSRDVKKPITESYETARNMGKFVLSGVEMGEAFWHNNVANGIIASSNFDIVLGSVHAAQFGEFTMPFSTIDFSEFSEEEIFDYMKAYFDDMLEMLDRCDFDVLSHFTNPLKYMTGKYGIPVNLSEFSEVIDKILTKAIKSGTALEVNTSCLGTAYDELMPEEAVLARFKELGGYLITIGSDAHTAGSLAHGFEKTVKILKELGFCNLYFYKNRVPIQYRLEGLYEV